jgi:dTDP-4-dehydrorhamnose 3,5-epimerase
MDSMKNSDEIEGVIVQPLKQIIDNRGAVLHMMKNDSEFLDQFGEVYFSEILPGIVKAWRIQKEKTQNLAVPINKIRLVIYDSRPNSNTHGNVKEYEIGRPDNYSLIHIPPKLWYGFQSLEGKTALVANCTDYPNNPDKIESLPPDSSQIPYAWKS